VTVIEPISGTSDSGPGASVTTTVDSSTTTGALLWNDAPPAASTNSVTITGIFAKPFALFTTAFLFLTSRDLGEVASLEGNVGQTV
jgi:hypothetical protein